MFAVAPGVSRSRAARPHVFGAASCWTPQHTSSRWEVESWLCRSVWRRVGGFGPCESALRLVTLGFQVPAREVPGGPLSTSVRFSKSTFVESGAWSNGLPARPWWRAAQSAVPCGLLAVCQDRAASKGQPGCPVAGVAGWPGAGVPRSSEVTRRHCPLATPGLSPGTAERLASECVGLCSVGPIVPGCCVPVGRAGLLEGEGCGPKVPFLWSLFKATGSPTSSTTSSFGSLTGKGGGRSPLMTSSRAASSCRYRAPEGGVSLWGRGFLLVPRGERCCPRPWRQRQLPPLLGPALVFSSRLHPEGMVVPLPGLPVRGEPGAGCRLSPALPDPARFCGVPQRSKSGAAGAAALPWLSPHRPRPVAGRGPESHRPEALEVHGTFEYLFVFQNLITTKFEEEQRQCVPVTRAQGWSAHGRWSEARSPVLWGAFP